MTPTWLELIRAESTPRPDAAELERGPLRWTQRDISWTDAQGQTVTLTEGALQLSRSVEPGEPSTWDDILGREPEPRHRVHVELRTATARLRLSADTTEARVEGLPRLRSDGEPIDEAALEALLQTALSLGVKEAHGSRVEDEGEDEEGPGVLWERRSAIPFFWVRPAILLATIGVIANIIGEDRFGIWLLLLLVLLVGATLRAALAISGARVRSQRVTRWRVFGAHMLRQHRPLEEDVAVLHAKSRVYLASPSRRYDWLVHRGEEAKEAAEALAAILKAPVEERAPRRSPWRLLGHALRLVGVAVAVVVVAHLSLLWEPQDSRRLGGLHPLSSTTYWYLERYSLRGLARNLGHREGVEPIFFALSHGGARIVLITADRELQLRDAQSGEVLERLPLPEGLALSGDHRAIVSPALRDETRLLFRGENRHGEPEYIRELDLTTMRWTEEEVSVDRWRGQELGFDADGIPINMEVDYPSVNAPDDTPTEIVLHQPSKPAVRYSMDAYIGDAHLCGEGRFIISEDFGYVIDIDAGLMVDLDARNRGHISPSGHWALYIQDYDLLAIWRRDGDTWRPDHTLDDGALGVQLLHGHKRHAFLDADRLAIAVRLRDKPSYGVLIWDLEAQERAVVLEGHSLDITHLVAAGPDGPLYTAARDGTIRVWELP